MTDEYTSRGNPAGVTENGVARSVCAGSKLVFTVHVGANEELLPFILDLHVPPGLTVADVTYGKGIFWKNVPQGRYTLLATDIKNNVDCWNLSYEDGSIDCMVLDPPYMEGFYRRLETQMAGSGTYTTFRATYSASRPNVESPKYHDAVIDLYFKAGRESCRVLCRHGILIVKCQDEVSANIQHLTQEQARKNHSCFPVFVRKDGESPRRKG